MTQKTFDADAAPKRPGPPPFLEEEFGPLWRRWLGDLYEWQTHSDIWHIVGATGEPAFQNSWQNYDNSSGWPELGFMKTREGIVIIHGMVENGAAGTVIFTLPVGYRPGWADGNYNTYWMNHQEDELVNIRLYGNGDVLFSTIGDGYDGGIAWSATTGYIHINTAHSVISTAA